MTRPPIRIIVPTLMWASMLALCLVAGCSALNQLWKCKVGFADPSFTEAALRARGVAVGGMGWAATRDEENLPALRGFLDSLLWQRLSSELKDVRVEPRSWTYTRIDTTNYTAAIEMVEEAPNIDELVFELPSARFAPDEPYLAFGAITENTVFETSEYSGQTLQKVNVREVQAKFIVYDAASGSVVWRSTITESNKLYAHEGGFFEKLLINSVSSDEPEFKGVVLDIYGLLGRGLLTKRK